MGDYILVIDEGTTSTRAIVFDRDLNEVALAQQEVPLSYPNDGWVEQDGEEIWDKTVDVCRKAIAEAGGVDRIAERIEDRRDLVGDVIGDRHHIGLGDAEIFRE